MRVVQRLLTWGSVGEVLTTWAVSVCVAAPLVLVVVGLLRGAELTGLVGAVSLDGAMRSAMVRSVAWAGGIATAACTLGWPIGWVASRVTSGGGRFGGWSGVACVWVVVLACAMPVLPMYLSYAGLGQARAPGTMLGDWLLERASAGDRWLVVAAGRAFAGLGLSVWGAGLAGVLIAVGLRRVSGMEGALRLAGGGSWAVWRVRVRAVGRELVAAWLVVFGVMLGSAVPLHVAQVPTLSIEVWLGLMSSDVSGWWREGVRAWPVVGVGVLIAWWCGGVLTAERAGGDGGARGDGDEVGQGGAGRVGLIGLSGAACVVAIGLVVPIGIYWINLGAGAQESWPIWEVGKRLAVIGAEWEANRSALVASVVRGMAVGAWVSVVACGVSVVWTADGGRAWARWLVRFGLVVGLMPGVLVGAGISRVGVLEGEVAVVVAHAARFGFVGVLGGVVLGSVEPGERRAGRMLDGAGVRGWAASVLRPGWWVVVVVGCVGVCLSVHEIEASILLVEPGSESVARVMLGHLHFARMNELNALSLLVVGVCAGVGAACCAAWLVGRLIGRGAGGGSDGMNKRPE